MLAHLFFFVVVLAFEFCQATKCDQIKRDYKIQLSIFMGCVLGVFFRLHSFLLSLSVSSSAHSV